MGAVEGGAVTGISSWADHKCGQEREGPKLHRPGSATASQGVLAASVAECQDSEQTIIFLSLHKEDSLKGLQSKDYGLVSHPISTAKTLHCPCSV